MKNTGVKGAIQNALGYDDTVKYRASMLPLVRTQDDKVKFGYPAAIISALESLALPGHVAQGGAYTPEDVTKMALDVGMMGAPVGYATAPKGAFAMGAGGKMDDVLPMGSQVRAENLKKWAGGSRVVDGSGNPLVVYHATNAPSIDAFDPSRFGKNTASNATDDAAVVMSKLGVWTNERDISDAMGASISMPLYLRIKNPFVTRMDDLWSLAEEHPGDGELLGLLKSEGYDGIKMDDSEFGGWSYVAFHPEQIKSVNNRGTFDPNDPRIMYSNPAPVGAVAASLDDKKSKKMSEILARVGP